MRGGVLRQVNQVSKRWNSSYIDCYYSKTLTEAEGFPSVSGDLRTDICIVGGGLAGCNTALGLVERGQKNVVVLEQNKIGWGASGRNGGFVHPGYSLSDSKMYTKYGPQVAREMYGYTLDAMKLIRHRIDKYQIDCTPTNPGMLTADFFPTPDETRAYIDFLNENLGTTLEFWPKEKVRSLYHTTKYHSGTYDPLAFGFHVLKFLRGIAKTAQKGGAKIFEDSPVVSSDLDGKVKTLKLANGSTIHADKVIFSCSGYIKKHPWQLVYATVPVHTYVMLTEVIPPELNPIKAPHCTTDNRFACDYYRMLSDGRLLWGGRVDTLGIPDHKLKDTLKNDMIKIYPQLKDVKVDVAWSGLMGYAYHKMPQIGVFKPNVYYHMGYGGHGLCATTAGSEILASHLADTTGMEKRYERFSDLGFLGGPLSPIGVQAFYWAYMLRDIAREYYYSSIKK